MDGSKSRGLGRGVVVAPGADPPAGWAGDRRVRVDPDALASSGQVAAALHGHWLARRPIVVELAVSAETLRETERCDAPPYELTPAFEFGRERLFFLVWANNYDARDGSPRWWWSRKAAALGAREAGERDVVLPDGTAAFVDGGPRQPLPVAVVHRETVERGSLTVDRYRPPSADLAPDQLAAVAHEAGAARIIAPAGSGKTRVLAERLRHLLVDRAIDPGTLTALAYNTRAADELKARTGGLPARIRTIHALGYSLLREAAAREGRPVPRVLDERDVRSIIEKLVPVRPIANTDVFAPYLEALAAVRVSLRPPEEVERSRDDVPGFANAFPRYQEILAGSGSIDFDTQIYGAIELLLRDPAARRAAQGACRHLLVDEFQDLTPGQLLLIRLLAAPAYHVFGVGDDDQVIYGYAGAEPGFLIGFGQYFPGAAQHALEINYRCPEGVVTAVTNLLSRNRRRIDKKILSGSGRAGGLRVERTGGDDLAPRAAGAVSDLVAAGVAPSDVAVLGRVNSALLPVQIILTQEGVPCDRPLGPDVLARTGVRAALAYLRIATAERCRGRTSPRS